MRYLHTMLRVKNLDTALKFYRDALGLKEVRRIDNDKGKFTLVFLCAQEDEHLLDSHAVENLDSPQRDNDGQYQRGHRQYTFQGSDSHPTTPPPQPRC